MHTAVNAAMYAYKCGVRLAGILVGHTTGLLEIVTTGHVYTRRFNPFNMADASGSLTLEWSVDALMALGDTAFVRLTISGSTRTIDLAYTSGTEIWFSGSRVFNA
jgi:hypothetical protein